MPEVSRSQVFVYGAVAVALLLVGVRAIRAADEGRTFEAPAAAGSFGTEVTVGSGGTDVVVDVAGAVQDPGVYRLPSGSRVVDALVRAGGPSNGAMLEAINRAARLVDGQQVVVPRRMPAGSTAAASGAGMDAGPISLGAATVEQLEEIDGIGPVTAQKIVEYRDGRGGLASVDQLDEVSGIGPATMESLRASLQP
jgi:competence protein ComEA